MYNWHVHGMIMDVRAGCFCHWGSATMYYLRCVDHMIAWLYWMMIWNLLGFSISTYLVCINTGSRKEYFSNQGRFWVLRACVIVFLMIRRV